MISTSNIQVKISLQEPGLDDHELQSEVENLLPQLRNVDGIEQANLVAIEEVPVGARALGGFLIGMLTAEVNPANIKALWHFLVDRLGNKSIALEIEKDGKKLKIQASSRKEFELAFQKAQEFLAA